MLSEFVDILLREVNVNKLSLENVITNFYYPKLVIVSGKRHVLIIDIEYKDQNLNEIDQYYKTEADIIDIYLQEQLLWLIFSTGEIKVHDLITNVNLPVLFNESLNNTFNKFRTDGENLYIKTESEECFKVLYSASQILNKFKDGPNKVHIILEKQYNLINLHSQNYYDCLEVEENVTGLHIKIERGALIVECPVTGLRAVAAFMQGMEWESVLPWRDVVALTNGCGIWIVSLSDEHVLLKLKEDTAYYKSLMTWRDSFYYLVNVNDEIQLHQIQKISSVLEQGSPVYSTPGLQKTQSQLSLKAKLNELVQSILTNVSPSHDNIMTLQQHYSDIHDLRFLLTIGTNLCHQDLKYKTLLSFLRTKAHENHEVVKDICNILIKIDILEYIQISGNNRYDKMGIFNSNSVNLCILFISNTDFDLASFAWVKFIQIKEQITENDVTAILNATPYNIKMNEFKLWLKIFIPPLLDNDPFYVDILVKWITDRIFALEKSPVWPKVGIKFIDELLSVLQFGQNKLIHIRPISMDGLDILRNHVTKINNLKEKHKINILLRELNCLSSSEVSLIMLQRCYTEDLETFLHESLSAFAAENYLDLDNLLKAYIERETSDNGGCTDEGRLQIILKAFRSNTMKLECLLSVLCILDVPWTGAMYELALSYINVKEIDFTMSDADLQLIYQIKTELNFASLKVTMKKYNFPLSCTDYLLVLHKVISMPNVDLNDLKVIVNSLSGYSNYGSLLYINRCLQDCSTKNALDYFKTINEMDKKIILKSIISKYDLIVNDSIYAPNIERCYLDFIIGTHALDKVRILNLENIYYLKNSFKINISLNYMCREREKNSIISNWLLTNNEVSSSARGACVTRLSNLPKNFFSILVDLLSQSSANFQIQNIIESLATVFGNTKIAPEKIEPILQNFKESDNLSILMDCCSVLVQLICNCPEDYIHLLVKILSVLNAIVNTSITVRNLTVAWKFHYVYIPMSNISSTDNLLTFYSSLLANKQADTSIISYKNDFVPFRMLSASMYTQILTRDVEKSGFSEAKKKFAQKIISSIVLSQECDELLLASSLLMLGSTFECEHKYRPDWFMNNLDVFGDTILATIMKFMSTPMMCRALSLENVLNGNLAAVSPLDTLKSKYNFNLMNLTLPDITEDTWDGKLVLYYYLRSYPDTDTQTLINFCHILHVEMDDGLSFKLISLLVNWELKYKVYNDDYGCLQIKYENNEKDLITKCSIIWDSIKNKSFLIDILKDFWKKGEISLHGRLVSINAYYYEIFLCIHKLFERHVTINVNEFSLLIFLRNYRRMSSPKQYEFEMFSIKGMFPEIGHYRLPFQLFMREDMWVNLKSEITLATYEQWLPVASLLELDSDIQIARDMLCSNALKQTMTAQKRTHDEIKLQNKHNESWCLHVTEESLLGAARRCARHIANMEWAGACLFYVLQGCARGADQVAAAQLCSEFAQRWATLQPANRAVCQMQKLYSNLSTRHALHKINWTCEDLLKYSAEPIQLIKTLYLHPDFIIKMTRYDVNKTVDEIADKNNVDIASLRIQILENILEQKNSELKDSEKVGLLNENLLRAKYILKATCPKMGAMYLARIAFEEESDYNRKKKLSALQCLVSTVEPDTALKVTNQERKSLWLTLIDLLFSIRLENVDMPWAVATFTKDKIRTLDQICASEYGLDGLRLAAELSIRYGYEQNIRGLIPHLLTRTQYDLLSLLLCKSYIQTDELICSAWHAVLLSPFAQGDYPITERQRHNCLMSINMLPLCPCLSDKLLNDIWRHCIRMKCYPLACLILPFMSVEGRQLIPELKKIDKRKLLPGIKNLQAECFLVNGAVSVLDHIATRN